MGGIPLAVRGGGLDSDRRGWHQSTILPVSARCYRVAWLLPLLVIASHGHFFEMIMVATSTDPSEPALRALRFARFDPVFRGAPRVKNAIGRAEVHVWAYLIDEPDSIVEAWSNFLSRDEKLRADRFVHSADRGRWIVAHGALRHVLARYCGDDPGALAFACGESGKPFIARAGGLREPITFNLAHSRGRALLAVANDRAIGVDLETNRDDFDPLPLARQFFFRDELTAILEAPVEFRRDAFFRHWVAKESVLKAEGVGLSFPLDSFCVTFGSETSGARVQSRDPARLASQWFVRMLPMEAGWHGAVASSGEDWKLRFAT